jgi:para-nitrobenzyl esterase
MRISTILLLCFAFSIHLQAQNPGCDGVRYKDDVFVNVKKTTVQYTTAPSYYFNQTIDLFVDIYEPEGDAIAKRPVVLLAHGGTFIFGNKQDMKDWCERYARKGYVAASIQYRLYPVFPLGFPDSIKIIDAAVKAVSDMKAAVRFLHQDAAGANQFRVDTDHIFIGGYSAGAVAALHAAYLDSTDTYDAFIQTALSNNGGFRGNSGNAANLAFPFNPGAVVNMSGGIYRRNWITQNSVPLMSIHGTVDGTVAYNNGLAANLIYLEGSGILHPQAESVGILNELLTVEGGGHTDVYSNAQYLPQRDSFTAMSSSMMEFLSCTTSSTPELEQAARSWNIYPNPASETVRLQLPNQILPELVLVQIFDNAGKLIVETRATDEMLSLSSLQRGVYSIRITDMSRPGLLFPVRQLVKI